jgi:hypothetical protein
VPDEVGARHGEECLQSLEKKRRMGKPQEKIETMENLVERVPPHTLFD